MARKKITDSFDDLLNSSTTTSTSAAKSKANNVILPVHEDVQVEIDNLLEGKKEKKLAESKIAKASPIIIDYGLELKDEKAFNGEFQKSFKLGNEENHVNMVTVNSWSFKEDDVELIKEIIDDGHGKKKIPSEEMLLQDRKVQLKREVFADQEMMKKFIKMVGKDFPEFFETVVSHHVSEDFDQKIYEVLDKEEFENLQMFCKQKKPSLR